MQHGWIAPVRLGDAGEGDLRDLQFRAHEVAANGSSSREGWSASCSTICVERCQFHESASQGCTGVDGLRSYNGKALLATSRRMASPAAKTQEVGSRSICQQWIASAV